MGLEGFGFGRWGVYFLGWTFLKVWQGLGGELGVGVCWGVFFFWRGGGLFFVGGWFLGLGRFGVGV